MGLDAEVIAIGPYSKAIQNCLEYPPAFYEGTREGSVVNTLVFLAPTSLDSNELASYFGIEAFDFARHKLDPYKLDLEAIRKSEFVHPGELECFLKLRDAGFTFYYLPNA